MLRAEPEQRNTELTAMTTAAETARMAVTQSADARTLNVPIGGSYAEDNSLEVFGRLHIQESVIGHPVGAVEIEVVDPENVNHTP